MHFYEKGNIVKGFNSIDRLVAESLHRMKSPEMVPLHRFITELMQETQIAWITAEGDKLTRLQGRAGVLKEFLDAIDTSAQTLEKLR